MCLLTHLSTPVSLQSFFALHTMSRYGNTQKDLWEWCVIYTSFGETRRGIVKVNVFRSFWWTVLRNDLCIFVVFSILFWFVATFIKHVDKIELNCETERVLVCHVKRRCVWVWKREISVAAQTLSVEHLQAPEAIPTHLQGGRQVNEKLLILPLYPRRWWEVTLILPNFVFPFLLMPWSFDSHSGSLGMWTTERRGGSMRVWCRQRRLAGE